MSYPKLTPIIAKGATEPRYLEDRFTDIVNVRDFGAKGDGETNDTAAFEAAAKSKQGNVTVPAMWQNLYPFSATLEVYIPNGVYIIDGSLIDVGNKDIVWILAPSAKVVKSDGTGAYKYLNGIVCRDNRKISVVTPYGGGDSPNGFVLNCGESYGDQMAPVTLGTTTQDLADYNSRDIVGTTFYTSATADVAVVENVTYTSNSVTLVDSLSDNEKKLLRKGMIIDTLHDTRCTGLLTGWSDDFSVLYVNEWCETGGSSSVTPDNSAGVVISGMTKVYGVHSVTVLDDDFRADRMINGEFVCINKKKIPGIDYTNIYDKIWGIQSGIKTGSGCYKGQVGIASVGQWIYGFLSWNSEVGYEAYNTNDYVAYRCKTPATSNSFSFSSRDLSNNAVFSITGVGDIEMGSRKGAAASNYRFIDFHASPYENTINYDARIAVTKADYETSTTTDGRADLILYAKQVAVSASDNLRPFDDNVTALGRSDKRWSQVYAASSSISTSDERLKEDIGEIDERLMRAWGRVKFVSFKFKDAVAKKGSSARLHIGVIAQRIIEEFEREGLNPFDYGLLCYDSWDKTPAITRENLVIDVPAETDEDGKIVKEAVTHTETVEIHSAEHSGDIYSVRYEEALALECAYQRWCLEQLEERINQLTNSNN